MKTDKTNFPLKALLMRMNKSFLEKIVLTAADTTLLTVLPY